MLTLFTTAKPFKGHPAIIQRNAIKSWTLLQPRPEIIIFGDEDGAEQVAAEFGMRHVPQMARNEFGTPLLNGMFEKARELARTPLLAYVNADIMLVNDFIAAVERVSRWSGRFMLIGQRTDVDLCEPWDFSTPDWAERLATFAMSTGRVRRPPWIDYFVFSQDLAVDLQPFAIGRFFWENWLIWHALRLKAPVVDASRVVVAIHQNHEYSPTQADGGAWRGQIGKEAQRNRTLAGGWKRNFSAADATHCLLPAGITWNSYRWVEKSNRVVQHYCRIPWFAFLDITRPLRHRFGIRKKRVPDSTHTAAPVP